MYLEDGIVLRHPNLYGVLDGVSSPYTPGEGPKLYEGLTDGQVAVSIVKSMLNSAKQKLGSALITANKRLERRVESSIGIDFMLLPGVNVAVAEISQKMVTVITTGDCFAFWRTRDGMIKATPNLAFGSESELNANFARIMEKHKGDRQKAWREHIPFWKQSMIDNYNHTFAVLNGQGGIESCWQRIELPRANLDLLILLTDGFVPFEDTRDAQLLAEKIEALYCSGGLCCVLMDTHISVETKKAETHVDYPEATAIALEF